MSHLNYLLLHCSHAHEWYKPSPDAQWVFCACNWLVFAGSSGSKGLCSGQTCGMPCIEIFCWTLEPFKMNGISTLATPIFVFISQPRIKALLVLVWWPLLHILMLYLFYAWLKISSSCTCHLIILCIGVTLDLSGPLGDHQPPVWFVLLWPWSFPSSWQVAHLACGKLVKVYTSLIDCLGDKILIF